MRQIDLGNRCASLLCRPRIASIRLRFGVRNDLAVRMNSDLQNQGVVGANLFARRDGFTYGPNEFGPTATFAGANSFARVLRYFYSPICSSVPCLRAYAIASRYRVTPHAMNATLIASPAKNRSVRNTCCKSTARIPSNT